MTAVRPLTTDASCGSITHFGGTNDRTFEYEKISKCTHKVLRKGWTGRRTDVVGGVGCEWMWFWYTRGWTSDDFITDGQSDWSVHIPSEPWIRTSVEEIAKPLKNEDRVLSECQWLWWRRKNKTLNERIRKSVSVLLLALYSLFIFSCFVCKCVLNVVLNVYPYFLEIALNTDMALAVVAIVVARKPLLPPLLLKMLVDIGL